MATIDGFHGRKLRPGDDGYDEARTLYNAMIDRRPAVIAQCTGPDDVARAIAYARHEELPLAVKAGGHSVAGACLNDGGVVIDVSPLQETAVDPERRVARVGAGVRWGEFDRATQEHALATTGGRISTTGVAGLTLGGGSGWLERSHGLACDNLLGVELVTAEGELVRASETENAELFWALHGGGGNFGVATAFEFRLREVGPQVFSGLALYDPNDGREVTRAIRDFHEGGPVEAGLVFGYITAPDEDFVPQEWRGRLVVVLAGMWNGAVAEGERALRPLIAVAEPVVDLFGEHPYAEFQCMIDDPPGFRNWWTAEYVNELPDEAVDAFCDYSSQTPLGHSQSFVVPWGGAVAAADGATPLTNRDAAFVIHPFVLWEDAVRDAEHIAWGKRVREVFSPWATGATYLNFIGDEGEERVRAAFGPAYERLVEVKTAWDPDNVFSGNQNIKPRELGVIR